MSGRPAATPPTLAGFTPVGLLGSGGYADVFLYEQHMPSRRVAVKVLVGDSIAGDSQRRQFAAEANLMARVSTHPYIVSIFQADVADDGRPYIVMEYYPGANFLRRARTERFSVAETLRIGIQVGSALETAHRAGILHRDVKPANILTSEFRRPGLADFGIASALGPDAEDAGGVSIPWSPPEAFSDGDLGVEADVYSLSATLYHLLAGRSPFEVTAGDNSGLGLMSRIERAQVPPIGRADVPSSLERVLSQAMAKSPNHRPSSVVELLRQLQMIEAELQLSVTPLELADDGTAPRLRSDDPDDDATRIRGVTEIQAQGSPAITHIPSNPTGVGPAAVRRREGLLAEPEVASTVQRPQTTATSAATPQVPESPHRSSRVLVIVGAAVLCIAVLIAVLLSSSSSPNDASVTTASSAVLVIGSLGPSPVIPGEAFITPEGAATFSWTVDEGALPSDEYIVTRQDTGEVVTTNETSMVVKGAPPGLCVSVVARRDRQQDSSATEICVLP